MEMISKFSRTPVAVPRGRRLRLLAVAMPLAALLATACSPAQTSAASSGGPARQPAAPPPSPAAGCNLANTKNAGAAAVGSRRLGSTEGGVMSTSAAGQIGGEHCVSRAQASSVNAALQAAASQHVTVVAASGDIGAVRYPCDVYSAAFGGGTFPPVKGVGLLAPDPLVLGAGGTAPTARHTTVPWVSETAWGLPYGDPGSAVQA